MSGPGVRRARVHEVRVASCGTCALLAPRHCALCTRRCRWRFRPAGVCRTLTPRACGNALGRELPVSNRFDHGSTGMVTRARGDRSLAGCELDCTSSVLVHACWSMLYSYAPNLPRTAPILVTTSSTHIYPHGACPNIRRPALHHPPRTCTRLSSKGPLPLQHTSWQTRTGGGVWQLRRLPVSAGHPQFSSTSRAAGNSTLDLGRCASRRLASHISDGFNCQVAANDA